VRRSGSTAACPNNGYASRNQRRVLPLQLDTARRQCGLADRGELFRRRSYTPRPYSISRERLGAPMDKRATRSALLSLPRVSVGLNTLGGEVRCQVSALWLSHAYEEAGFSAVNDEGY
jgi:hypothetical protein